jgi:hypothetical protein
MQRKAVMKRVLFITSNNLATNPRLVKELGLANSKFRCTVLSFQFLNWSDPLDAVLKASFPGVVFKTLSAGNRPFSPWLLSSVIEKSAQILYPMNRRSLWLNAFGHSKRSFLLWKALKKHKPSYDLVIAHNLASLYPSYLFAKKHNIPFAFDIEDYHPGEKISKDIEKERSRREFLMQQLLPAAAYSSYASPLIGEATLDLVPNIKRSALLLINNAFLTKEFTPPLAKENCKLHFVWFSQHIAPGRGLELIIPALYEFKEAVHITLIGNLNSTFFDTYLKAYADIIHFHKPLPQAELHRLLATFDIGLAFESGAVDFNRELCLTNKLFAYVQAGLFVLATTTKGQTLFVEQNPWCGKLTRNTAAGVREVLQELIAQKQVIRYNALVRFEKSKTIAWEQEQEKLINVWNHTFDPIT